jgi:hypothetical protein
MVNLFQILNQFVLFFGKNVIEMIWPVLPLVKINTRISETPCMLKDAEFKKLPCFCIIFFLINTVRFINCLLK